MFEAALVFRQQERRNRAEMCQSVCILAQLDRRRIRGPVRISYHRQASRLGSEMLPTAKVSRPVLLQLVCRRLREMQKGGECLPYNVLSVSGSFDAYTKEVGSPLANENPRASSPASGRSLPMNSSNHRTAPALIFALRLPGPTRHIARPTTGPFLAQIQSTPAADKPSCTILRKQQQPRQHSSGRDTPGVQRVACYAGR